MTRYLYENIKQDLTKKAILISGPRQVGKTTLAKSILEPYEYLNYDVTADRKAILAQAWKKDVDLVIFDELHKLRKWKNFLKGIIDQYQNRPALIVTGSAKLEVFKRAGDALTGRTYSYHLHPIDIAEARKLVPKLSVEEHLANLLACGGFPESFFDKENAPRLLRDRLSTVLREDLEDLSLVSNLKGVELLVELLRERVGGQLKYANLAKDLAVSAPTVKTWVELLEKLYMIFLVRPFSKQIAKSIRKESKYYFFDCSAPLNGQSARLENLVALSLLKWCDFERDTKGRNVELKYFRDAQGREVDFVITENSLVLACIEVKTSDESVSNSLKYLTERLHPTHAIQLVQNLSRESDYGKIKVRSLAHWLSNIVL
jgi:predicted AAA+ superfamily ATPase